MSGSSFWITDEAAIGRAELNDITLTAEGIQEYHARIYLDESRERYLIEDMAGGGLAMDGMPVRGPVRLPPLSVVTFAGQFDFLFQVTDRIPEAGPPVSTRDFGTETRIGGVVAPLPAAFGGPAGTRSGDPGMMTRHGGEIAPTIPEFGKPPPATHPPAPIAGPGDEAVSKPVLTVMTAVGEFKDYPLAPGENVVGRSADCDVAIEDASLSRRHAAIVFEEGRFRVRDLGSKNGTFLDEDRLTSERSLEPKQIVRFGHVIEASLRLP